MTKDNKKLIIRNSTVEFLIFTSQAGKEGIEVRVEDENVWLTQKLIAKLFDVEVNTINYHLKEIFKTGELLSKSTIRKFRIVQKEGNREVARDVEYYNLEGIIAIGFRVSSERATNFRRWAMQILKNFAKGIPMTMADWAKKLNIFLSFNNENILQNVGKATTEIAKSFVESEFEKYRPIQDKLFESDFDREVKKYENWYRY